MAVCYIKLYGSIDCHKTQFYINWFESQNIPFEFLDVVKNQNHATELRNLYTNNKLNFPTITVGEKKLRNPHTAEIEKQIKKRNSL